MFRNLSLLLACQVVVAILFLCPLTRAHPCGDCTWDEVVNTADIVYLMNYCFLPGPPPPDIDTAEADGYEFLNIRDAVYLVNYLCYGGPSPTCPPTNPEYQPVLEPSDTIKITWDTLQAGDSLISIPISYKNSEGIRGIALPLKVKVGGQIPHIDSVVLGARTSDAYHAINSAYYLPPGTVNSGFLWTRELSTPDSLPPGSGPIFTIYLSIAPESFDREVLIDTLRLAPFNSPLFVKPNLDGVLPVFVGFGPDSLPFAPAVNYATGHYPRSVFCADLDGDGNLDIAGANQGGNNVSIFKNNGDGTFQTKNDYQTAPGPSGVFCADLDGDGNLDLAVACAGSDSVSVLKNYGDGTFYLDTNYAVGDGPYSVFCADLDADNDLDLAVGNGYTNDVSILKNYGDGTFYLDSNYAAGDGPYSVFCGDLDGDNTLDIVVANVHTYLISILKNNGDGTFYLDSNYAVGDGPASVFCADLDKDSYLDLAVANFNSGNISILKNYGDGTFYLDSNYTARAGPYSVFCADLDGDLDLDLAVANYGSDQNPDSTVTILKNNGDGTFQTKVDYRAEDGPVSVFCADLDGDGDFDLAVADIWVDSVSILKNLTQIPANQPPWAFHLGSPANTDTTIQMLDFDWQDAYDPNLGDQIRYDLYVSTTPVFEPQNTIVDSNLMVSKYTDTLEIGTYYWKVKAKDNWGASTWSQETYRFFNSNYVSDTLTIVAFSPVDLIVTDPVGDSIGIAFNTIPNADYDTTQDYDGDQDLDDIITIPDRLVGDYLIRVVAEPGDTGTYSLGIRIDGSSIMTLATDHPSPSPGGEPDTFSYNAPWYLRGDPNGDWKISITDVVYLINYLFLIPPGPAPIPQEAGDANCDGMINVTDVVYLINYLFLVPPGPPPCG